MTTNDEQYVPSEAEMREAWIATIGWPSSDASRSAEFDRFLARVRRDAAREALDGLVEKYGSLVDRTRIADFRDTHYPIPEETP